MKTILFSYALIFGLLFFTATESPAQWAQINSGLTNTNVRALAVKGTTLFAGTSAGVFVSTDNGSNWTASNTGLTNTSIASLALVGASLFAGSGAGVFVSTNNGNTWNSSNAGMTSTNVYSFAVAGPRLYAGGLAGVFVSTDNGNNWTADTSGLANKMVMALATSDTNIFAGTYGTGVFRSSINSGGWVVDSSGLTSKNTRALVVSGNNLFVGTDNGICRRNLNGTHWTGVTNGSTGKYDRCLAVNGPNLLAGTSPGGFVYSNLNGSVWTGLNSGLTNSSVYALAIRGSDLFAGTYGGGVFLLQNYKNYMPSILSVAPNNNTTDSIVTVVGSNFGQTQGASTVKLDTVAASIRSWNDTVITARIPPGVHGCVSLFVTVNGTRTSSPDNFYALNGSESPYFLSIMYEQDTVKNVFWNYSDGILCGASMLWYSTPKSFTSQFYCITDQSTSVNAAHSLTVSRYDASRVSVVMQPHNTVAVCTVDGGVAVGPMNNITPGDYFMTVYYYPIGSVREHIEVSVSSVPLPVELSSWSATTNGLNTVLRWTTATESGNSGFDIERRVAGRREWTRIGSVAGAGTSNIPHSYSYTDNTEVTGRYTYRLKQIDRNGMFKYSEEVEVTVESPKVFALNQNYPNPFNPTTTIRYSIPNPSHIALSVFNTLGQKVAELVDADKESGVYNVTFDASGFASGVYFYRMQAGSYVDTKKLILLK